MISVKEFSKKLLSDVRFWILIFFLIRLIGITNPPLEVTHNWRQTTVTMVARNFYEVDHNIFLPRIDFAGDKTGITGMEFPFLNYLIYLMARLFGYDHWYGRLINLIVTSIGTYYFFLLVRKYFNPRIALYASVLLLSSVWFSYARKIMPDTFSMALLISGMYFGTNYLDREASMKNLFFYSLLSLLGIISKLPSGFLLIVFVPLFLDKNIDFSRKAILAVATGIYLLPVAFWYFKWVPFLVQNFGFYHFFMGESLGHGAAEILHYLNNALEKFYFSALKFSGFAMFLYGLFLAIKRRNKKLLVIFVLSLLTFLVVMIKGGHTFALHEYYIIPFVPVMALVAAFGLDLIPKKQIGIAILCFIVAEGIFAQWSDFVINENNKALVWLESDLDRFSNRDDLIAINSGEYPTPMYFAHRKGWLVGNDQLAHPEYVEYLRLKGCRYIVVLKKSFGSDLFLPYPRLLDNKDYSIYQL